MSFEDWVRTDAERLLKPLGERWLHVQAVARNAAEVANRLDLDRSTVVQAAWLHDIGYAPELVRTGMHAIDGAVYLESAGVRSDVVALVAHHTGAVYEASERGLLTALERLPSPPRGELAALTFCDLISSPTGKRVGFVERLDEILSRYQPDDPVHRAVLRSRPQLEESCRQIAARLA